MIAMGGQSLKPMTHLDLWNLRSCGDLRRQPTGSWKSQLGDEDMLLRPSSEEIA